MGPNPKANRLESNNVMFTTFCPSRKIGDGAASVEGMWCEYVSSSVCFSEVARSAPHWSRTIGADTTYGSRRVRPPRMRSTGAKSSSMSPTILSGGRPTVSDSHRVSGVCRANGRSEQARLDERRVLSKDGLSHMFCGSPNSTNMTMIALPRRSASFDGNPILDPRSP